MIPLSMPSNVMVSTVTHFVVRADVATIHSTTRRSEAELTACELEAQQLQQRVVRLRGDAKQTHTPQYGDGVGWSGCAFSTWVFQVVTMQHPFGSVHLMVGAGILANAGRRFECWGAGLVNPSCVQKGRTKTCAASGWLFFV